MAKGELSLDRSTFPIFTSVVIYTVHKNYLKVLGSFHSRLYLNICFLFSKGFLTLPTAYVTGNPVECVLHPGKINLFPPFLDLEINKVPSLSSPVEQVSYLGSSGCWANLQWSVRRRQCWTSCHYGEKMFWKRISMRAVRSWIKPILWDWVNPDSDGLRSKIFAPGLVIVMIPRSVSYLISPNNPKFFYSFTFWTHWVGSKKYLDQSRDSPSFTASPKYALVE